MRYFEKLLHSRTTHPSIGSFLAILWVMFAWSNFEAYIATGSLSYLAVSISEFLQAFFFLIRRAPSEVSTRPYAWFVAISATIFPLLLRPSEVSIWRFGDELLMCGIVIQVIALLSLNRSFAIAPANRGIKTGGLYTLVRHPMYASYLFIFLGYVLQNSTIYNLEIVLATFLFLMLRVNEEEKLLSKDSAYLHYKKQVPWRVIPFIY